MLQSRIFVACILRLDMQNPGGISCYMSYVIDSPCSIELEISPRFRARLAQYWIIRPIVKLSTRPHGLFALPAALHAWERTCHFKHCSYVIFTSNTDEIRGVSIVKNIAVICHYHFWRTFRYDFVNTYTCVNKANLRDLKAATGL